MALHSIIILSLYAILGILFFAVVFYIKYQGRELYGKPTMNKGVQMIGKVGLFIPVLLLPAAALGKNAAWIATPEWMIWFATFLCFEAMLFLYLSLLKMGKYTKMGLPVKDEIILQTGGIFGLSRNPMYFGLFLLALASVLYVPNPINLVAAIVGVFIHHKIINGEEKYLEKQFGRQWLDYKSRVRKYF